MAKNVLPLARIFHEFEVFILKNFYEIFRLTVFEVLSGPERSLKPVGNIYFFVDIVDMSFHGMGADAKLLGNSLVAESGSDTHECLFFSHCQTG